MRPLCCLLKSSDRTLLLSKTPTFPFIRYCASQDDHPIPVPTRKAKKVTSEAKRSHKALINSFFKSNPHLSGLKANIPEKYLVLKRVTPPENLCLIEDKVAEKVAKYILDDVGKNQDQVICETNAGLGLISSRLLDGGIELVRLYESCPEFTTYLKRKFERFTGRVELFTKDVFLLHRYTYIDKQDNGSRVEQLLKGVTKKSWEDDPIMTIVGVIPNINFPRFLIKSLVLQNYVTSLGRIQLFAFMRPRDFIILSAGPHLNLHTYQHISVLFNLFFDYQLLDKFPREVFLPWQSVKTEKTGRYPGQVDSDQMYFVKINFKRKLPVSSDNLLPLYSFVRHFFGRGTKKIIPTLENWVPGCGLNLMFPEMEHDDYFPNLNIFTIFGELTPQQLLAVFLETIHYPGYEKVHFMNIIESELAKTETIESGLDEHINEKPNNETSTL